jgi:hypothetical protein
MKFFLAWFVVACFSIALCAAEKESLNRTIDYLIGQVEKSECKFVRNGDEHTGKEASEHMRAKYNHFKKEIKTPEDFIAKCASKSELSGKPYMVRKPDGETVKCEEWLKSALEDHRKALNPAADSK